MTVVWFIVWLIANTIGDKESLTFDPANVWAPTARAARRRSCDGRIRWRSDDRAVTRARLLRRRDTLGPKRARP